MNGEAIAKEPTHAASGAVRRLLGRRGHVQLSTVHAGLATMTAVLAWEWAASASHKITSDFVREFPIFIHSSIDPSKPGVFNELLSNVLLRAPTLFALTAIALEAVLGVVFTAATVALFVVQPQRLAPMCAAVVAAAAVSFPLAVSLAIINGDALPWNLRGNGFESGITVEYLLAGVSLASLTGATVALRRVQHVSRRRGARREDRQVTTGGQVEAFVV